MALLAAAAFFAFWSCAALAYALIATLSLWMPRWAAAWCVLGALLLLAAALALIARRRMRKLESPGVTVRRHLDESLGWWQDRVLEAGDDEPEAKG